MVDKRMNNGRYCVVVFGDIGRSQRMMFHAKELADNEQHVSLVGYSNTEIPLFLKNNPFISLEYIFDVDKILPKALPKPLKYMLKLFLQLFLLFYKLLTIGRFNYLLLQNPPLVPAGLICWFMCLIFNAQLIVDWHNLSHSMIAFNHKNNPTLFSNIIVYIILKLEILIGRSAYHNLCVTKSMSKYLNSYGIKNCSTLYDLPSVFFKPLSKEEKTQHLNNLKSKILGDTKNSKKTTRNQLIFQSNDCFFIVCSTSYTEDEDLHLLIDALEKYDNQSLISNLPSICCIITGKGNLYSYYADKINAIKWKNICISQQWFNFDDYISTIASADFGVCLHVSTSAKDLPMKIIDLYGCEVPVVEMKVSMN